MYDRTLLIKKKSSFLLNDPHRIIIGPSLINISSYLLNAPYINDISLLVKNPHIN